MWIYIIDLLKQATGGKSIWFVILRLVLVSTVYHIWIEMNNRIFEDKRKPYEAMAMIITDEVCSKLIDLLKAFPNVAKSKMLYRLPIENEDIATQHPP